MKTLLVLSFTVTQSWALFLKHANITLEEGNTISPLDVDRLNREGTLVHTFNEVIQAFHDKNRALREENRRSEIFGFICASLVIRQINTEEFDSIKNDYPESKYWRCHNSWYWYITKSYRPAALMLRGEHDNDGLLNPSEFMECAHYLCDSYSICRLHILDDKQTTRIVTQIRNNTMKTILELLMEEDENFLLTTRQMELVNIYIRATGNREFPFITFQRKNKTFAIPQIREPEDFNRCPYRSLCKN